MNYGRRKDDFRTEYCPTCHNSVEPGHLDSHMYHAHGVERRQGEENRTPPPPERKPKQQKPAPKAEDGEEQKPKAKTSRYFQGRG